MSELLVNFVFIVSCFCGLFFCLGYELNSDVIVFIHPILEETAQ